MKKVLTNRKQCNIINLASSAKGLNANRETLFTGCGSAWLERLVWDQEVAGSNPVTPTCNLDFVFIFQKISTKLLTNDVG